MVAAGQLRGREAYGAEHRIGSEAERRPGLSEQCTQRWHHRPSECLRGFERVDGVRPGRLEMAGVARHDGEAVLECCGGYQEVGTGVAEPL